MGQAMTSETLSISGGDGHRYWVGLQAKPISRGAKKTVYKGVLLGSGPRQWEKVVGKAFTDMPGTRESWGHEVKKATITRQMSRKFAEEYPSGYSIQVVIPGVVQMDKVSKVSRWQERRQGHRSLGKEDWISIEEFIPGRMYRFSPWYEEDDVMESDHLQTFSHFTYKMTNGELVACDFQGIYEDNHFTFTDSIIHSRLQTYGRFDEGEYGITEFFKRHKCTKLCSEWPVPMPLTPPPPFDEVCGGPKNKHVRFDLTPYENVVFPSQRIKPKKQKKTSGGFFHRRASYHLISRKKPVHEEEPPPPAEERLYPELPEADGAHGENRPRTFSEGAIDLGRTRVIGGSLRIKPHVVLDDIPIPEKSLKRSCLKRTLSDQRGTIIAPLLPSYPLTKPVTKEDKERVCSNGSSANSGSPYVRHVKRSESAYDGQQKLVSGSRHEKNSSPHTESKSEHHSIHRSVSSGYDKTGSRTAAKAIYKTIQGNKESGSNSQNKTGNKSEAKPHGKESGGHEKSAGKTESKSHAKEGGSHEKSKTEAKSQSKEGNGHDKSSGKTETKSTVKEGVSLDKTSGKTESKSAVKERVSLDKTSGKTESKSTVKEGVSLDKTSGKTESKSTVKEGVSLDKTSGKTESKSTVKEGVSLDKASGKTESKSTVKEGVSLDKTSGKTETKSTVKEGVSLDKTSGKTETKSTVKEGVSLDKTSGKTESKSTVKEGVSLDKTSGKTETKSTVKEGVSLDKTSGKTETKSTVKEGVSLDKTSGKTESKSTVKEGVSLDKTSGKTEAASQVKEAGSCGKTIGETRANSGSNNSTSVADQADQTEGMKKSSNLLQRRLSRDKGDTSNVDPVSSGISELTIELPRLEPSAPALPE